LLLAVSGLVFLLYDRLLGMSTLSGSAAREAARPGPAGRLGAAAGDALIAGAGWLCDLVERAVEAVAPARPDRPGRSGMRALLWVVVGLVLAFLCLPSFFVIQVSFTSGSFIQFPPEGFSWRWYQTYLSSPG